MGPLCKCSNFCKEMGSSNTRTALVVAFNSGLLSLTLKVLDFYLELGFLKDILPELMVFNGFVTFAALVASFRTAHALTRYSEAASYIYRLHACWYDAASTLVAFCRYSKAEEELINQFQHTTVVLVSTLNAFCLAGLTNDKDMAPQSHKLRHRNRKVAQDYEVKDLSSLDVDTQRAIRTSDCPPEMILQSIQQLVIDGMSTGVLTVPPPILTRSFQELGAGLLIYHEAKKLAHVPLPYAYTVFAYMIICAEAIFAPFMLAAATRGASSAFFFTFGATFLLWYLNGVADALNNPFKTQTQTLDAFNMQKELNSVLVQLLSHAKKPSPTTLLMHREVSSEFMLLEDWADRFDHSETLEPPITPLQQKVRKTKRAAPIKEIRSGAKAEVDGVSPSSTPAVQRPAGGDTQKRPAAGTTSRPPPAVPPPEAIQLGETAAPACTPNTDAQSVEPPVQAGMVLPVVVGDGEGRKSARTQLASGPARGESMKIGESLKIGEPLKIGHKDKVAGSTRGTVASQSPRPEKFSTKSSE